MTAYSPLTDWLAGKLGLNQATVTPQHIEEYQLAKINETINWALRGSAFYRKLLAGCYQGGLTSLASMAGLPFTSAQHISEQQAKLVCVSQSEISRIVTLESSGTSGQPKRIYFTAAEQAATLDFFCAGLSIFAGANDRVLILLPGDRPGSVGELLKTGAAKLGMTAYVYGLVDSPAAVLAVMSEQKINVVIGLPVQCLALARYCRSAGQSIRLKSVLLTADYVPAAIIEELKADWQCQVYEHYGMTEMGLGGAMQCSARYGYHLREADLYFEIINPITGQLVPDGEQGEVVFTTLTRQGMPLIRYRTGDTARIIAGSCPCGTVLRRLDKVRGRRQGDIAIGENRWLSMADLDDALFPLANIVDFYAVYEPKQAQAELTITLVMLGNDWDEQAVCRALYGIPAILATVKEDRLSLTVNVCPATGVLPPRSGKRTIERREIS